MSLAALAGSTNYSKSHLSKVESGVKQPSADLARRCDTALGAAGALARLAPREAGKDIVPTAADDGEIWTMNVTADGRGEFHAFNPDTALAGGVSTLMSWAGPAPGQSPGAELTLSRFRALLDELRRMGQVLDPGTVIQMVIPAANALRALAARWPADGGARASRLAARFAEYAGWMAQEQGNEAASLWWTSQAVGMAAAGADDDMASYALVRRAEIALYNDDAAGAVELARRAQLSPSRTRTQGFASQREAQGHALAGDEWACRRALDRAAALMGSAAAEPDDGEAPLGSTTMRDPVAFVSAWCMQELGHPRHATEVLVRELADVPPHAHRVRARYGARLAVTLASQHEIDEACRVTEPVLATAISINSATVRHDLRLLRRALNRWRTHPEVVGIMPALTSALYTNQAPSMRYRPGAGRRN